MRQHQLAFALLVVAAAYPPPITLAQQPRAGLIPGRESPLGRVIEDLQRLGLVTEIREPMPGLLQLTVGEAYTSALDENLLRLYTAYAGSHPDYHGAVVLELFRGNKKIGEYTRNGLAFVKEGRASNGERAAPPSAPPEKPGRRAAPDGRDGAREEAPRVVLDCSGFGCDYDFLRTEINFVNHVRDRQGAQVLVLITRQETAAGGLEFTINFIGQREFRGTDDVLRYTARPAESQDQVRQALAEVLKRGLVRYVNHTPIAAQISVAYTAPTGQQMPPLVPHDPWNSWTFSTTLNGSLNGEKSFRFISLNASVAANRTTEAWKINTSVQARYSENRVQVSDSSTVNTISRDYGVDALVVKSLGGHWSAGVEGTLTSSTFLNQSLALRLAPAVEYNIFPYAQSTWRQFTIQYSVGTTAFNYAEETIFGKTAETLVDQKLLASLAATRPWGSIALSLEGSSYLHDLSKRHGMVVGNVDLHLFGGFSLLLLGGLELVRDQLYLSSQGASEEEILLRQRQLATSTRYWSSIGFGYTFGSPFANVVNPRFGGSSGGMPIVR
jgi:opacity protein-like surface antigen